MNELIKLRKSTSTGDSVVSARDLHEFLEVGKDFSTWIKLQIEKWGFVENIEYARLFYNKNGKRILTPQKGGMEECGFANDVYRIEYAITLDCAKEISMVQNNAKGKEARLYFIAKEKELQELKLQQIIQTNQSKQIIAIDYTIAEVAKTFKTSSYNINQLLRKNKYFKPNYKPYEKWINQGLFIYRSYNPKYSAKQLRVTGDKGVSAIQQLLSPNKQLVQPQSITVNQPAVATPLQNTINENRLTNLETALGSMFKYILLCKSGKNNRIEEENYLIVLRKFQAEIGKMKSIGNL